MDRRKKRIVKPILIILLLIVTILAGYYGYKYYRIAKIACGYQSKMLCSEVFIAGRNPDDVMRIDLANPLLDMFDYEVNYENKKVTSSLFGIVSQTAYYSEIFGGVRGLDPAVSEETEQLVKIKKQQIAGKKILPEYKTLPPGVNGNRLDSLFRAAFTETDSSALKRTRGVVVVYKDTLVAERYGKGFNRDTPLLGWSMTKSVTNAMAGILAAREKLDINIPAPILEWQEGNDPRQEITWDNLFRMNSGLEFKEAYGELLSDVLVMLFLKENIASFPVSKPLVYDPGDKWYYSSGTTNIISRGIRSLSDNYEDYYRLAYEELFTELGMSSAVLETDAEGIFVGSSFMYATPRDWAKFGMLYANEGMVNNKRILSAEWVEYSGSRTTNSVNGNYGAHFWVKPLLNENDADYKWVSELPDDYFYAAGHDGQYVSIFPSLDLVIVRMGFTQNNAAWNQFRFAAEIASCFPVENTDE